jgi:hypothetical protein
MRVVAIVTIQMSLRHIVILSISVGSGIQDGIRQQSGMPSQPGAGVSFPGSRRYFHRLRFCRFRSMPLKSVVVCFFRRTEIPSYPKAYIGKALTLLAIAEFSFEHNVGDPSDLFRFVTDA